MKLKGNDLIVFFEKDGAWKALAYATTCEVDIQAETIAVGSPDTGRWAKWKKRRKSWSVSSGHLLSDEAQPVDVLGKLKEDEAVRILIGSVEPHKQSMNAGDYMPDGKFMLQGNALVTRMTVTGRTRDFVTMSMQMKGNGELAGSSSPTDKYTIAVNINPDDIDKCSVTATGDVVSILPLDNGTTIVGIPGGTITLEIVLKDGYRVQEMLVDNASKGDVQEYTFEGLESNHTVSVILEEDWTKIVPPIYIRSDVSAAYFGIYNVIQSVLDDYPDGLTQDVTITCTQTNTDYKGNKYQSEDNMWTAEMSNWNQDTPYMLTVDGANKCTLDGRGFGGIRIQECNNLVFKNITFQNFNTYEGVYAPEEPACIYAINVSKRKPCRNLYFENITIKGQSTKTPTSNFRTRYGITVKGYENVYMHNIRMSQVVVQPISVSDAQTVYVSKLKFSESTMQSEVIGHPSIMHLEATEVHILDCDIDGSYYNEVAISTGSVKRLFFKRNHVYKTRGPVLGASNELGMEKVIIANNYLHDNMTLPKYQWDCTWLSIGNAKEFMLSNNTIVFSSDYFQEFFVRGESDYGRLTNVNNIFIRKNDQNHGIFLGCTVGELIAGNNIYALTGTLFYSFAEGSNVYFKGQDGRNWNVIRAAGYEDGSEMITDGSTILMSDRPCLLPALAATHKGLPAYVEDFDSKYETNTPGNCSIGCDNYYSTSFDEKNDATNGYSGINYISGETFDNRKQYGMPSDQTLVLLDKSKNRDKFTKFIISKHDNEANKIIALGKLASFSIQPKLDENGEYVADQLYDVTIE